MKKTIFIPILSLLLIACEPTQSQTNNDFVAKTEKHKKVEKSFEWNWLAGMQATNFDQNNVYAKNYYFLVDGSGSMSEKASRCGDTNERGDRLEVAKKAISQFVNTLPDNVNLGLLSFDNQGISERLTLGVHSKENFNNILFSLEANGGTPLSSATKMAYENIKKQALQQAGHGEYNLIIITDGEANSGENPRKIIEEISLNSPVNLFAIGFCIGENHSLNDKRYVNYYTANDAATIISSLGKVVAESEYNL